MFQIGYLIMLILILWVISTIKNDAKNLEMKQIVARSPYIMNPSMLFSDTTDIEIFERIMSLTVLYEICLSLC